jgi:hypothetical protein
LPTFLSIQSPLLSSSPFLPYSPLQRPPPITFLLSLPQFQQPMLLLPPSLPNAHKSQPPPPTSQ